jgi:hypothetical protein
MLHLLAREFAPVTKGTTKRLKTLNMAKPLASLRLRLSGGSAQKRSSPFRFRFVSFRPISPARCARLAPGANVDRRSARPERASRAHTPCRPLCDRMSLVGVRTSF